MLARFVQFLLAGTTAGSAYALAAAGFIITIGVSLIPRGLVRAWSGKGTHTLQPFSGGTPIQPFGATLLPQSLWAPGATALIVLLLAWFSGRTLPGKTMLATSCNKLPVWACKREPPCCKSIQSTASRQWCIRAPMSIRPRC